MKSLPLLAAVGIAVLCFVTQSKGTAERPQKPETLLRFLTEGMQISISSYDKSPARAITIYDDEEYQMALDATSMTLEDLRNKYPKIDRSIHEGLMRYEEHSPKSQVRLPQGKKYAAPEVSLMKSHGKFAKVIHVEEDYVLVEFNQGGDHAQKQAIAISSISHINLGPSQIGLVVGRKVIDENAEGH